MLKVALLSSIIILFCVAALSAKIIAKKNGRFPDTHVGGNPALRKKGISCAQAQDFEARLQKGLFDRLQE